VTIEGGAENFGRVIRISGHRPRRSPENIVPVSGPYIQRHENARATRTPVFDAQRTEERVKVRMTVDLNKKLAQLKAKRHAVEQAIVALQQLDAEYRDRKDRHRIPSSRRPVSSLRTFSARRIA
jgi:hypothetical protein